MPKSEAAKRVLAKLAAWDGEMAEGRMEPLVAVAWWRELARAVYADELGAAFPGAWSSRAVFLANVLANHQGQAAWCDDVRTRAVEGCDEVLAATLERALADLRSRYGEDPARGPGARRIARGIGIALSRGNPGSPASSTSACRRRATATA